ncbi:TPA: hypothetical protein ACWQIQ_004373 [Escherichia coli]|uniref:hypothetical protein n=1 Tax=Citrobacter sp. CF971 TaxID=2566012 RepID=UPI00143D6483|nr:hypothetical protein [Citrobacter sp. CF971]EFM0274830.1 hypothetical protein [Escherichia coli]EFU7669273.1 hypothetical protein [Escherichia coli]EHT5200629.1 hypothetical protein [Escherichia coli]EJH9745234.1 hypothetical protein [Escherichia coli]EMC8344397.1 hypothetical protein [Escherichia coli]
MARLLPFLKMDTVLIISSWPTGLYDYVQYMQMQSICIVIAYADGKYMRMPHLCRCPAYGYVEPMLYSLFSRSDPKKASSGSSSDTPARSCHETQDVAVFSAVNDAICCVPPLPRDRPLTTIKWRFAYSLTVLHFRKIWNTPEIGSPENRHPVI